MRVIEFAALPDDDLRRDVLIVGSGPAGIALAAELAGSGRSILVLESGGRGPEAAADALNEVEDLRGLREPDQTKARNRVLGGASTTWSGRVAAFDEVDFAPRDRIASSGWPIEREALLPYLARALPYVGTRVPDNLDPAFVAAATAGAPTGAGLVPYAWTRSEDDADPNDSMRLAPWAERHPMPGVECVLHATAVEVLLDGDRVRGLLVADAAGRRRTVSADTVVLAGGGIENARLLLASRSADPRGVGNAHDQVGRNLMDHVRGPVGTFDRAADARMQRLLRDRLLPEGRATPGWALSADLQRREDLLNCAVWLHPLVAADDPLALLAGAGRGASALVRAGRGVAQRPVLATRAVSRYLWGHRTPIRLLRQLELHAIVEQEPDPDRRITLSDATDRFGVPLSRIDWWVSDREARTLRRAAQAVGAALADAGLPTPRPVPAVADPSLPIGLRDAAHPTGTTRMSRDPRDGVVDTDAAVHGVVGLYVAGSSVFPTSGHANPTQTIVALAIRLADHLRGVRGAAPSERA